ncbi:MAG: rhomboid family intramembrane serine protease, partial [Opitutales bacterium]
NVEDYLGKLRFLLILVCSTMVGSLTHWMLEPNSVVPLVGASGGISGVIVFYALQFKKARIAIAPPIVSPIFALFWLIRLRVAYALLIWFVIQAVTLYLQSQNLTNVSAAAHLGGAAVGAIFWKLWRMRVI